MTYNDILPNVVNGWAFLNFAYIYLIEITKV